MILENYDVYRNNLIEGLSRTTIDKDGIELDAIYAASSECIDSDFELHERWYKQFLGMHEGIASYVQRPITITAEYQRLLDSDGVYSYYRSNSGNYYNSYIQIAKATEDTEQQINQKLETLWKFSDACKFDRVRVWNALSKLERMKGNHTLAATYQLRIMRSQGGDLFGALPYVKEALCREGFPNEANVAELMFNGGTNQHERCLEYLDTAYQKHLLNDEFDYEFVERHNYMKNDYKVTVIVSMYNAADKLKNFISRLQSQTLFNDQEIEVIFVETGSPAGDYDIFKSIRHLIRFPVTYARTVDRETIQSAWNRGISLSRGEYLSFLGVDETIAPRCFEILVGELERDASLDWVIGNSLVTEVDDHGTWIKDVMMYNRTGYHQDIVYLETCYLSWVGALYRKSIHQRFGYYDASFRAAGDTEFKSRILPQIKSKVIPLTLGYFMNYADERTTESPRAEIEDLRAWYLYRTSAGAEYVYRNRSSDDIGNALIRSLQYRKSYKSQMSSDIDFAASISAYLAKVYPASAYLKLAEGVVSLQDAFRSLDFIKHLGPNAIQGELDYCMAKAAMTEKQHRELGVCNQSSAPMYGIFNDNRYEQHFWPWKSDITTRRKTADKIVWL
jgi:glycosyltransferase involved in cell wall biosynthesis